METEHGLLVFTLSTKMRDLPEQFSSRRQVDNFDYPYHFTKGFRQIFWRVFSRIRKLDCDIDIKGFDKPLRIHRIVAMESDGDNDMTLSDGTSYFIALDMSVKKGRKINWNAFVRERMEQEEWTEGETATFLFNQIFEAINLRLFDYYQHENHALLGLNIYSMNHEIEDLDKQESVIYLNVLYHFGKLLFWRVSRAQVGLEMTRLENNKQMFEEVGLLKIQVLNLRRFFHMKNVSNDPEIKVFNRTLRDKFHLATSFTTVDDSLRLISEVMENRDQLNNYTAKRNITLLLNITAFLSVPLAVISTIMALNPKAPPVANSEEVFTTFGLYMVVLISIVLPITIYGIFWLINRAKTR